MSILSIDSLQFPKMTRDEWIELLGDGTLKNGEIVIVIGDDGKSNLVEGNGVTPFEGLPYLNEAGSQRVFQATVEYGGYKVDDDVIVGTTAANANAIERILKPYILPTITNTLLTPSPSPYNQMNVVYSVAFHWQKNKGTSNFVSGVIQYKRASAGVWISLDTTFTDSGDNKIASATVTVNTDGPNNESVQFRAKFTDATQENVSSVETATFQGYSAPTKTTPISNQTKETGNISNPLSSTIVRTSLNVALPSFQFQYQVNGSGAWLPVPSGDGVLTSNSQTVSVTHNDAGLKASTSLNYRVAVTDANGTTYSGTGTVTYQVRYWYSTIAKNGTTEPVLDSDILAASGSELRTARQKTLTNFGGGAKRLMFVLPYSAGLPTFKVNGLGNSAFTVVRDNSDFTNAYGHTYKVRVILSDNIYNSALDSVEVL